MDLGAIIGQQPDMIADTTVSSYWLNWKFFICAVFILGYVVIASILIWRYEGCKKRRGEQRRAAGLVYSDEVWGTCSQVIHPAWLLAYRIVAFTVLFGVLVANVVLDGGGIFYFYTQWTFALVTAYFALGSALSIYGCCKCQHEISRNGADHAPSNIEHGTNSALSSREIANMSNISKQHCTNEEYCSRQVGGAWHYVFQIMYQALRLIPFGGILIWISYLTAKETRMRLHFYVLRMISYTVCGGAVVLTDCVFWLALYPLLLSVDYRLDFIMLSVHSFNAIFLLGDTILNNLRFPMFRIGYFILWTCIFVFLQWIFHAFVSLRWPYPFMDLSREFAELRYMGVGLVTIPCYGVFALIIKLKHVLLSRSLPKCDSAHGEETA